MPQWEADVRIAQEALAKGSIMSYTEKFMNFSVFTSRQTITRFLLRHELFKKIIDVPGSIFECGVLFDGVLTDCGMYYTDKGEEVKKFNTRDGQGIELLKRAGIKTGIAAMLLIMG